MNSYIKTRYWMVLLLLSLSAFSFLGCQSISQNGWVGCWSYSYEENKSYPGKQVYRPCTYSDFPPSRFRFSFELFADGACKYLELAPNDAHYMKDGKWVFNRSDSILVIKDVNNEVVRRLHNPQLVMEMLQFKM